MKTILYSVSTGYFARNLLKAGVIERLLKREDIRIVIVTPGYDDDNFIKDFSFSARISLEKMHEVDRSYDFMDRLIWKAWTLGHKYRQLQSLYKFLLRVQIRKRYYNKFHKHYKKVFDKYNPDLVVGASPGVNSRLDIPVFAEAQKRRIRTLALIHSWDNIAKRKGPMWIRPDILGVWNEFQEQDAVKANFYKKKEIKIVGPPHFDIYWKKDTFLYREDFFKKIGLDCNKKTVTMIATCPGLVRNSYIVDLLLDALRKNKFVVPVQLICRPTPSVNPKWNDTQFGRFDNNPDIFIDRQVQHSAKLGWKPDNIQLYHFANLLQHSDIIVNIVSTATIEAAILDRPVVLVSFSTLQPEMFDRHITNSVCKEHFKIVVDSGATYMAKDPDDLIAGVNKYLIDPAMHRKERNNLKNAIVYKADGKAVERISRLILELIDN